MTDTYFTSPAKYTELFMMILTFILLVFLVLVKTAQLERVQPLSNLFCPPTVNQFS